MTKPVNAAGYDVSLAAEARRLCLYVATILGDLSDEIVVAGGLVPYLIVDQEVVDVPHVGTRDLDLGLALALLDDERYREISARLRDRGFRPGTKSEGQATRQTWVLPGARITIDFRSRSRMPVRRPDASRTSKATSPPSWCRLWASPSRTRSRWSSTTTRRRRSGLAGR